MLEGELVLLINSDPTVAEILAVNGSLGGFGWDEVAQNLLPPTWAYRMFGGQTPTGLLFAQGWQWRRLDIRCVGDTPENAILLGNAIYNVLQGFSGRLPLAISPFVPGTLVDSIFVVNSPLDQFVSELRDFSRILEFRVSFNPLA